MDKTIIPQDTIEMWTILADLNRSALNEFTKTYGSEKFETLRKNVQNKLKVGMSYEEGTLIFDTEYSKY